MRFEKEITTPLPYTNTLYKSRFGYVTNEDFLYCLKKEFLEKGIKTEIKKKKVDGKYNYFLVKVDGKDFAELYTSEKEMQTKSEVTGKYSVLYDLYYD